MVMAVMSYRGLQQYMHGARLGEVLCIVEYLFCWLMCPVCFSLAAGSCMAG